MARLIKRRTYEVTEDIRDAKARTRDERIDQMRAALIGRVGFIAGLLDSPLVKGFRFDPCERTASTDGDYIYCGDWLISLPLSERMFVGAHEILHIILDHVGRADDYSACGMGPDLREFDDRKWNSAGDYIVNYILHEARVGKMPGGGLYNPNYTGDMCTDLLYTMLPVGGGDNFDTHRTGKARAMPRSDAEKAARATAGNAALRQGIATAKAMGQCPADLERLIMSIT